MKIKSTILILACLLVGLLNGWAQTPVINRALPVQNVNNAAGVDRCNVQWRDTDRTTFYGDDFTLPAGAWVIDKLVVWGVAGFTADVNFELANYFDQITLYTGAATGSSWEHLTANADIAISSTMVGDFTSGSSTNNSNITITKVNYYNGEQYQDASGAYKNIYKIEFDNLNWIVKGGQRMVYGVNCAYDASNTTYNWFNLFSNAAKGGATADQSDGLMIYFDVETPAGIRDLEWVDPLLDGLWNKNNDAHLEVYADRTNLFVDDDYNSSTAGWGINKFASIQTAINASIAGDVIEVAAGTYVEWVTVDKQLELRGPNWNTPGNGTRVAEAIIKFPADIIGGTGGSLLDIGVYSSTSTAADGTIIKGFMLDGTDYKVGYETEGIKAYQSGVVIQNNIVKNFTRIGIDITSYWWTGSAWDNTNYHSNIDVSNNLITNPDSYSGFTNNTAGFGIYLQGTIGNISNNVVEDVKTALQVQPYEHPNTAGTTGLVTNNTFEGYREVIWYNAGGMGASPAATNWSFTGNKLTGIAPPPGVNVTTWGGFRVSAYTSGTLAFNTNSVDKGTSAATNSYGTFGDYSTSKTFDATCNWWGSTVPAEIAASISGPATYIPYSVSDGGACEGAPVVVRREGTFISSHTTIQAGIDAATTLAGDVISVAPGTYNEAVTINKGISLVSTSGRDVTFISTPFGTLTTAVKITDINLGVVTIDGFTVKDFTADGIIQPMSKATGTSFYVYNCKVFPYSTFLKNGIQVSGNGSKVIGNYVVGAPYLPEWGSTGINVVNASHVLVQGNTVNTDNTGHADYGIIVQNYNATLVDDITVEANTVDGADNSGIQVSGNYYTAHKAISNVVIQNNIFKNGLNDGIEVTWGDFSNLSITGNQIFNNTSDGIWFGSVAGSGGTDVTVLSGNMDIHNNQIYGNNQYNVNNENSYAVNATCNWYGTAVASEVAAEISGVVDFLPCKSAIDGACDVMGPVVNTTKGTSYVTIQSAVNAATAGDVIEVAAGTYLEDVDITKSVTIIGDPGDLATAGVGPNAPVIDPVDAGFYIEANVTDVTIRGFEIKDANSYGISTWEAGVSNIYINNNYIHNAKAGIYARNNCTSGIPTNWNISYNIITQFGDWHAILLKNASNSLISYNEISDAVSSNGNAIFVGSEACAVEHVTVSYNQITDYPGLAMVVESYAEHSGDVASLNDVNILHNTITGSAQGIFIERAGVGTRTLSNFTITNNSITITNPSLASDVVRLKEISGVSKFNDNVISISGAIGGGGTFFHGIDIDDVDHLTGNWEIKRNQLNGNNVGAVSAGIRIRSNLPSTIQFDISENTITKWAYGIYSNALPTGALVNVHNNSITQNPTYGVKSTGTTVINATCNWWGSTVPATISASISGPVTYIPYSVSVGGACEGAPVVVRRAGTFISSHTTIQAGIAAADAGDVIEVAAGTYTENLTITKSLSLIGSGTREIAFKS